MVFFQLTSSAYCFSSQEQRMHTLQARLGASEQALAALEQTATEQMEGLTQQSSHALERLQRQLGQAYSQLEQLHSFIKVRLQRGKRVKAIESRVSCFELFYPTYMVWCFCNLFTCEF